MKTVTVGEWQQDADKFCKDYGERYLIINIRKQEIVGQVLIEEPPADFVVKNKYTHNR